MRFEILSLARRESFSIDRISCDHDSDKMRKKALYAASALLLAIVAIYAFAHSSVLCFGESCLERYSQSKSDNGIHVYVIKPRHCYISAEYLFASQYAHLKYSTLIGTYLKIFYIVYPAPHLFIIPSKPSARPLIAIDVMRLARHDEDIEFCDENVQVQIGNAGLIVKTPGEIGLS